MCVWCVKCASLARGEREMAGETEKSETNKVVKKNARHSGVLDEEEKKLEGIEE